MVKCKYFFQIHTLIPNISILILTNFPWIVYQTNHISSRALTQTNRSAFTPQKAEKGHKTQSVGIVRSASEVPIGEASNQTLLAAREICFCLFIYTHAAAREQWRE